MKITAPDLLELGIIDRIIPEPAGGAHAHPSAAIQTVGEALAEELAALATLSPDQIRRARAERFYAIGRLG